MSNTNSATPKVYVSTYQTYNNGSLEGQWIDLDDFDTKEDFYEHLSKLNCKIWKEDDPEYMFQDYENYPEEYYSESGMEEDVFRFIQEVDDEEKDMFIAFLDNWGFSDFDECFQQFVDRKTGYDNWEDFAYEYAEQQFDKNFIESGYFNFDRYESDLKMEHTMLAGQIFRDY
tara:strand:- start:281 stop:796 length:516 start_codon:yes stop_codon:yes gene_type:complete